MTFWLKLIWQNYEEAFRHAQKNSFRDALSLLFKSTINQVFTLMVIDFIEDTLPSILLRGSYIFLSEEWLCDYWRH